MKIQKAVVTAAGPNQRTLPLQTIIDRDGMEKTVLRIIVDEIHRAGVDQIAIVISPGDESAYAQASGDGSIRFIQQRHPAGYADALYSAHSFTRDEPFLHLVGDHLYVSRNGANCARELVQVASEEGCSVSAVQPTRETLVSLYGTVGGQRVHGKQNLYRIDAVIEKPTPTEAEQTLAVSGLRAGHYLCFFGMHVFTPGFMDILCRHHNASTRITVSAALSELAGLEQYLALEEETSRRYDVGVKYGLFQAQLALALNGKDRDAVLAQLLELLALQKSA
jgi:UTP--glucose-1-phosphate uridylyltransferase